MSLRLSLCAYFQWFNLPNCRHEVLIFAFKDILAYFSICYITLHLQLLHLIFSEVFVSCPMVTVIFRSCFSWKYTHYFIKFPHLLANAPSWSVAYAVLRKQGEILLGEKKALHRNTSSLLLAGQVEYGSPFVCVNIHSNPACSLLCPWYSSPYGLAWGVILH